jgi:hypothetical protein
MLLASPATTRLPTKRSGFVTCPPSAGRAFWRGVSPEASGHKGAAAGEPHPCGAWLRHDAKAFSAWLAPAYGGGLDLRPDLDQVEGLSAEREALWARIDKVSFLTVDEKRAAVGYGRRCVSVRILPDGPIARHVVGPQADHGARRADIARIMASGIRRLRVAVFTAANGLSGSDDFVQKGYVDKS